LVHRWQMGVYARSVVDGWPTLRLRSLDHPQHRHSPDASYVYQDSALPARARDVSLPEGIPRSCTRVRWAHHAVIRENVPQIWRTVGDTGKNWSSLLSVKQRFVVLYKSVYIYCSTNTFIAGFWSRRDFAFGKTSEFGYAWASWNFSII